MKRRSTLLLLFACATALAQVEVNAQSVTPPADSVTTQDPQAMMAAFAAARASASRPGDDALSCEQLQEELAATAADPALQAHVQEAGAQAQKDMAAMEKAQGEIASQTATTVAGSLVPGASMGAMAATAANAEAAKARGADRMQTRMAQAGQMIAAMPTLMRGERVMQLAVAKKCEWAAGLDPAAPAEQTE
jgi:hypothetical protein